MNRLQTIQQIPFPPNLYSKAFLDQLVRTINLMILNNANPGDIVGVNLLLLKEPESGYGLATGATWQDHNGFIKRIRPNEAFAPSAKIKAKLGTVTVA